MTQEVYDDGDLVVHLAFFLQEETEKGSVSGDKDRWKRQRRVFCLSPAGGFTPVRTHIVCHKHRGFMGNRSLNT